MPSDQLKSLLISQVSKEFADKKVLTHINFDLYKGEVLSILGSNVTGKTTLINLLLGRLSLSNGNIQIFNDSPSSIQLKRQCGAMLQVSGGQKQRLLFALAICGIPKLLFLDEPSVGMDVTARKLLCRAITELKQQGTSIIFTTHYLEEADLMQDAWMEIDPLTEKERQALRLAKEGYTTEQISDSLHLSASTVRNYLSSAASKLNAKNRIEAARIAHQNGWL